MFLKIHFTFFEVGGATVEVAELCTVFYEHYSLLGQSSNIHCCISIDQSCRQLISKHLSEGIFWISCLFSELYSLYCVHNSTTSTVMRVTILKECVACGMHMTPVYFLENRPSVILDGYFAIWTGLDGVGNIQFGRVFCQLNGYWRGGQPLKCPLFDGQFCKNALI